jgi:hypothetical protein
MTAPGLAHRKRSGETNPFEVNVSNAFEHYITWGLALPYPILKVQVMKKSSIYCAQIFTFYFV